MKTLAHKWKQILGGLVFLSILGVGIAFAVQWGKAAGEEADHYPDAPFRAVGKEFPRIIPVREAFSAEESRAFEYLWKTGAISKVSPQEREVLQLSFLQQKYVNARDLAEKILEESPESVPAILALAQARFKGDGNLPRALFQVREARKLLEARGQANPEDADSREWYLRGLDLEYDILRDLDQAEQQLRVVELMEQIYQPMPWMKVWPLMKLKRLDDAEEAIKQMEKTTHWRFTSLNNRMCLAEQRGSRQGVYEAGLALAKAGPDNPVFQSNMAGSALNAFKIDEAESYYLKTVKLGLPNFNATAYRPLALLYIQQGRFSEALDALKKGHAQRAQRQEHTLQQDQGKFERTIGILLLALGNSDSAEQFTVRGILRPDRTGGTTEDATDVALSNGLVHWTVLCSQLQSMAEQAAGRTGLDRLESEREQAALKFQIWTLRQRLLKILQEPRRLHILRPYMPGQSEMESWLLGGLVQILPSGVAEEAIRQVREDEDHPDAVAYFDSLEAEVALSQGRLEDALRLARQALNKLPAKGEKLLRARTAIVAGEAARRLGRMDEAMQLFDPVIREFPQAFRLVQAAMPVHFEDDGSPEARLVVQALRKSPRFREDPKGFALKVGKANGQVTIAMFRVNQERNLEVTISVNGDDNALVADALKTFHAKLMSPVVDMSQIDINSLDGSLAAVRLQGEVDMILGPRMK